MLRVLRGIAYDAAAITLRTTLYLLAIGVVVAGAHLWVTHAVLYWTDDPPSYRHQSARMQLQQLHTAVGVYREERGALPEALDDLATTGPGQTYPVLPHVHDDPWGTPFVYERLGDGSFLIRSCGEDREVDTDDDIVWPPDADD